MIKYYMPGLEKLFILAAIGAVAYLLFKKIIKKEGSSRSDIKILSVTPLGAKERLIVCEIENKKFIMGVTQHSISHLHTFSAAVDQREPATEVSKNHYMPYFT